jgi:hypothetical protein
LAKELNDPEINARTDLQEAYWLIRSNRRDEAQKLIDRAATVVPAESEKMRAIASSRKPTR